MTDLAHLDDAAAEAATDLLGADLDPEVRASMEARLDDAIGGCPRPGTWPDQHPTYVAELYRRVRALGLIGAEVAS